MFSCLIPGISKSWISPLLSMGSFHCHPWRRLKTVRQFEPGSYLSKAMRGFSTPFLCLWFFLPSCPAAPFHPPSPLVPFSLFSQHWAVWDSPNPGLCVCTSADTRCTLSLLIPLSFLWVVLIGYICASTRRLRGRGKVALTCS